MEPGSFGSETAVDELQSESEGAPAEAKPYCDLRDWSVALVAGIVGAAFVAGLYYFWLGISHSIPLAAPILGVVVGYAIALSARQHRSRVLPWIAAGLGALSVWTAYAGIVAAGFARHGERIGWGDTPVFFLIALRILHLDGWAYLLLTTLMAGLPAGVLMNSKPQPTDHTEEETRTGSSPEAVAGVHAPSTEEPAE